MSDRRGQRRCAGCLRSHLPNSPIAVKPRRVAHVGDDGVPCKKVPNAPGTSTYSPEVIWEDDSGDGSYWDLGPDAPELNADALADQALSKHAAKRRRTKMAPVEAPDLYPPMHTAAPARVDLPRPMLAEGDLSATTAQPMRVDVPYLPHLLGRSTQPEPMPGTVDHVELPAKTKPTRSKNERKEADVDIDDWQV